MADVFESPDYVMSGDVRLAVYKNGPEVARTKKPPVIFLHGFPELARSFRHQMQTVGAAGYPAFAPDMRGYNRSNKPKGREHYGFPSLVADIQAIVDHYKIDRAIFVGHDLGAYLLWALPSFFPATCRSRES